MTALGKLPVWATAVSAWRTLAREWRLTLVLFVALALAFAVLWLPFMLQTGAVGGQEETAVETPPYYWWIVVSTLYSLPLLAATAVALVPLHRRILLGAHESTGPFPFRIRRRELLYFLLLLALSAGWTAVEIASLPAFGHILEIQINTMLAAERAAGPAGTMLSSFLFPMLVLMILAPFVYVGTRLSLALPAISVGGQGILLAAWRLGRGNGWRLAGAMGLALLPALLAMSAFTVWDREPMEAGPAFIVLPDGATIPLEPVEPDRPEAAPPPWAPLLLAPLVAASLLIEGTVLSLCYRALGGMAERARAGAGEGE